jgi:hypothetical protein
VFLIHELLQNAWDTNCRRVEAKLEPISGVPLCRLTVIDDDPDGFQDISHAYTLFAESVKKNDPTKRGRFNFGEKIVLSLCEEATILSTKQGVRFESDGTRRLLRQRTPVGSSFEAVVRMTREEYRDVLAGMQALIPPATCETWFNTERLTPPLLLREWEETLATEVADDGGNLRPTRRKTPVRLHVTRQGELGWLYEMGIPVVEIGTPFHVDIQQKVPLNLQRDNVRPAYLRDLYVTLLNHAHDLLDEEGSTSGWVGQALEDDEISDEAVRAIVQKRYGDQVVAGDPTDTEAMRTAAANGYIVVSGRAFTKKQWEQVRRAEAIPRAGKLFPTPKPYSDNPAAEPARLISREQWTPGMRQVAGLAGYLAWSLMKVELRVYYFDALNAGCSAGYTPGELHFSMKALGQSFFDEWPAHLRELLDLLIHEFGHQYCSNHLDAAYHRALTRLGAQLALLVAEDPSILATPHPLRDEEKGQG